MINTNYILPFQLILAITVMITTITACTGSDAPSTVNGNLVVAPGIVSDAATVTVNGQSFSTAGASIVVDDQTTTQNALQIGMQVTVQSQNSTAIEIRYDEEVKGPVDSLNSDGTLTVMGQTVVISLTTSMDNSIISEGDIVEASGSRDADDTIHATYLEIKHNSPNAYEVRGPISQLNTNNQTFTIGRLVVDYSVALFDDFSASSLANGDLLEVKDEGLQYELGSLFLKATKIERYYDVLNLTGQSSQSSLSSSASSNSTSGVSTQRTEIEAYVTQIISGNSFQLGSLTVIILPSTRFKDGQRSQLQVNSRVEVEGWINHNGELEAREIEFEDNADDSSDLISSTTGLSGSDNDSEAELEGVVTGINLSDGSFIVNGIAVRVGSRTKFENRQDQYISRDEFFNTLTEGQTVVEVKWRPFINYSEAAYEVEIEY